MIHDMHNDEALWEKYYHRRLPRLFRFCCWFHLLFCRRCRLRLQRLREDDELITELRTALNEMSVPENPKEYQRLYKLIEGKDIEK